MRGHYWVPVWPFPAVHTPAGFPHIQGSGFYFESREIQTCSGYVALAGLKLTTILPQPFCLGLPRARDYEHMLQCLLGVGVGLKLQLGGGGVILVPGAQDDLPMDACLAEVPWCTVVAVRLHYNSGLTLESVSWNCLCSVHSAQLPCSSLGTSIVPGVQVPCWSTAPRTRFLGLPSVTEKQVPKSIPRCLCTVIRYINRKLITPSLGLLYLSTLHSLSPALGSWKQLYANTEVLMEFW